MIKVVNVKDRTTSLCTRDLEENIPYYQMDEICLRTGFIYFKTPLGIIRISNNAMRIYTHESMKNIRFVRCYDKITIEINDG